ncbi:LysR family transcriptional regulator [Asticcacaulis endophyticus]|uniref:LysR family transcriptional regulator n=1 Tax=Asticcacaulis endophyticus TaxID=1395890 RepID=A0A918Q1T2_9CAUL|nr:LysR family transcriptional regulator [Asticcacaulis endophyticus]GGZ30885.1 LysR family transcriptional regulator [Asticcacaulis endophyticus]
MPVNLPTNLIRSFVAIVDTGSMLNASEQVFVTQSALSLQVKRLEELVQQSLFVRDGRRLTLTPAGDVLLDYARRVLSLHDEAVAAVSNHEFSGPVRIGMVQDFADTLLTGLLGTFASLHPDAQIFARVAGTAELQTLLERRQLDIIVGFAGSQDANAVKSAAMKWYGSVELTRKAVVPLAVIEQPCRFREAAIRTLENADIPYRIAVETPNLSTLKAAVQAGLAVSCRTHLFLHDLPVLEDTRLPELPNISCVVETAEGLDPASYRLAELTRNIIGDL